MTERLSAWQQAGQEFKYRGHRIFYRMEGVGEPLLLIHGFPTASWDWHRVHESLCERFQVIAPDLIGFGFSAKPRAYDYSIMDQADLLEKLLERLEIKSCHLLCHDYGDSVGQELLARFNERKERGKAQIELKTVCFLNGGLFPDMHRPRLIQKLLISPIGFLLTPFLTKAKLRSNFNAIFGKDTQPNPEEIDEFYALMTYNNGKAIAHKLIRYIADRKVHGERWVGALKQNRIPMRLINGSQDPISGRHLADCYEEKIPEANVVHLEGAGHYPQTETPDLVLDYYLQFVERQ